MSCKNCKKWVEPEDISNIFLNHYIHYWYTDNDIHYVKCLQCKELFFDFSNKGEYAKLRIAIIKDNSQFIILKLTNKLNSYISG